MEYAAKLQAQSIELAFSNSELDDLKVGFVNTLAITSTTLASRAIS